MLKIFNSVLRSRRAASEQNAAETPTIIQPVQPFFAIGDIHGCFDKLLAMLAKINTQRSRNEPVIIIGDMIDRGPESAQVLTHLFELCTTSPDTHVALMGNHEKMFLEFIDDPAGRGGRWLRNGGVETLASFGLEAKAATLDTEQGLELADALEAAMPPGLQDWMRGLPLCWSSGNMHCVHAAMSPKRPVDQQRDESLLWGHHDFLTTPRTDGVTVVHGHTIVPSPSVHNGRISVDTGAYKKNPLTAAHVKPQGVTFIQV